jgi:hypothetical protein
MMTSFRRTGAALAAALLTSVTVVSATSIYDNSVTDLNYRFNPGTLEVGDEIILGGTDRFITSFSFEYWALANGLPSGSFAGTPQVRIKFYKNDGAAFNGYATPGTVLFTSSWYNIPNPTDRNTLFYDISDFVTGFYLPVSNMTWSVQFQGLGGTDSAGVDIYSPPVVGGELNDYWEFNGGWSLKTNAAVDMNFAARIDATVPEPSAFSIAILGGLGLILVRWRLAKR